MGIKPSIYNTVSIQKDGRVADAKTAAVSIAFYEDILSPNITAKIQIADVGGSTKVAGTNEPLALYEAMKIRGGESVDIDIEPNSDSTKGIKLTEPLYINTIENVIREGNKEIFKINLSSRSSFSNESSFVDQKYRADVKISDHVKSITNNYLPSVSSRLEVDETSNNHGFMGNQRKPFDILLNLASKSVYSQSETSNSAGFLYFETLDKVYFKAIDNLVKQSPKASFYYDETSESSLTGTNNDLRIIRYEIIKNQNILSDMRKGAYSTSRRFFDPVSFNVTDRNFDFTGSQYEQQMNTLNDPLNPRDRSIAFDAFPLSQKPSKIITETFDRGTVTDEVTQEESKYIDRYISQRKVRYNSLFSQIISVLVPSNTNIHAGDVVECNLPKLNGSNTNSTYDFEQLSGKYLVKEVCHFFDTRGSYTSMKLVRDSFGFDTSR